MLKVLRHILYFFNAFVVVMALPFLFMTDPGAGTGFSLVAIGIIVLYLTDKTLWSLSEEGLEPSYDDYEPTTGKDDDEQYR